MNPNYQNFEEPKPQLPSPELEEPYWYSQNPMTSHAHLQHEYQKQLPVNKLSVAPNPLVFDYAHGVLDNGRKKSITGEVNSPKNTTDNGERDSRSNEVCLGIVTSLNGDLGLIAPNTLFHISAVKGSTIPKIGDNVLVKAETIQEIPWIKSYAKEVQVVDKSFTVNAENRNFPYQTEPKGFPFPVFLNTQISTSSALPDILDPEKPKRKLPPPPPPPKISKVDVLSESDSHSRSKKTRQEHRKSYYDRSRNRKIDNTCTSRSRNRNRVKGNRGSTTCSMKPERVQSRKRDFVESHKYSNEKSKHSDSDSKKQKLKKEVISITSSTDYHHGKEYTRKSKSSQLIFKNKDEFIQIPDDCSKILSLEHTDKFNYTSADSLAVQSNNSSNKLSVNTPPTTDKCLENLSQEHNVSGTEDSIYGEITETLKYLDQLSGDIVQPRVQNCLEYTDKFGDTRESLPEQSSETLNKYSRNAPVTDESLEKSEEHDYYEGTADSIYDEITETLKYLDQLSGNILQSPATELELESESDYQNFDSRENLESETKNHSDGDKPKTKLKSFPESNLDQIRENPGNIEKSLSEDSTEGKQNSLTYPVSNSLIAFRSIKIKTEETDQVFGNVSVRFEDKNLQNVSSSELNDPRIPLVRISEIKKEPPDDISCKDAAAPVSDPSLTTMDLEEGEIVNSPEDCESDQQGGGPGPKSNTEAKEHPGPIFNHIRTTNNDDQNFNSEEPISKKVKLSTKSTKCSANRRALLVRKIVKKVDPIGSSWERDHSPAFYGDMGGQYYQGLDFQYSSDEYAGDDFTRGEMRKYNRMVRFSSNDDEESTVRYPRESQTPPEPFFMRPMEEICHVCGEIGHQESYCAYLPG